MTLERAVTDLHARLRKFSWFVSLGTGRLRNGDDAIFLYVKSARHRELKTLESGWRGYPVVIRASGAMKPLRQAAALSYS